MSIIIMKHVERSDTNYMDSGIRLRVWIPILLLHYKLRQNHLVTLFPHHQNTEVELFLIHRNMGVK